MKREKSPSSFRKKFMIGGVGFFFFVLMVASFFGKRGFIEIYQTRRKQEVLFEKIDQLDAQKRKLERDIEELRNNPQAVEKKAREKLGLVAPGEIVIIDKKKR